MAQMAQINLMCASATGCSAAQIIAAIRHSRHLVVEVLSPMTGRRGARESRQVARRGREAGLGYRSGTEIDARVPGRREQNDDRVRRCARWRERTARILVRPEG